MEEDVKKPTATSRRPSKATPLPPELVLNPPVVAVVQLIPLGDLAIVALLDADVDPTATYCVPVQIMDITARLGNVPVVVSCVHVIPVSLLKNVALFGVLSEIDASQKRPLKAIENP